MGGRPKALLPHEGRSFLETILSRLDEAGVEERRVVLGVHAPEILEAVPLPETWVVRNPDPDAEMIDSFRLGLRSLPLERLAGVLLWPVDHPQVSGETVSLLLREAARSGAPVVVPAHGGRRGHPVVFASRLAPEIESAPASEGARAVVRAHERELVCIELSDAGILRDVDTPEDLE
jgi:nicotine blue oxidoreductase